MLSEATPLLDLTKQYEMFNRGDITAVTGWYYLGIQEGFKPCLTLMNSRYVGRKGGPQPYIIPLETSWEFADRDSPRIAANKSSNIARSLGFDDAKHAIKVHDIVLDLLPELQKVPPRETSDRFIAAYGTISDNNGNSKTSEIYDYK